MVKFIFRNIGFLAGLFGLGFLACSDSFAPLDTSSKDKAPIISKAEVFPLSGRRPLESRIQFICTDNKGIRDYRVVAGNQTITSSNPIDSILVFEEDTDINMSCTNISNNTSSAEPILVEVYQPSISQHLEVSGNINFVYDVSLTNLDSANLEIKLNEKSILTKTITSSSHSEIFENMEKGDYFFILSSSELSPDTISGTILNFIPRADLTELETILLEEEIRSFDLTGRFIDTNPEDNPVKLLEANPLEGNINSNIQENVLTVQAENIPGNYAVELNFGSPQGGIGKDTLFGNIIDLLRISGQIQNLKKDAGALAEGAIYFPDSTLLKKFSTDLHGNFDFKLEYPLSSDSIFFQTRLQGDLENFVRTLVLPAKDTSGLIVRAHQTTIQNIKNHLEEINPNFYRWILDTLSGVEILDIDPLERGRFSSEEQDLIEEVFRESHFCYTGERKLPLVQKDNSDSEKHYSVWSDYITPHFGWILVVPNNFLSLEGSAKSYIKGNNIERGRISIRNISEFVIAHEFGHVFIAPGDNHAETLSPEVTIMRSSFLTRPGIADCEAALILNEPTFKDEENYDRILGEDFFISYYR